MATYTLTVTLPAGATIDNYYLLFENCLTPLFVIDGNDFPVQYDEVCNYMISYYGGTCTYVISGDDVTFTLNPATMPSILQCCEPIALYFELTDGEANLIRSGSWVMTETTLCPNCQPLAITNCGAVEISLPLPDDDYTVTLYDNQSGVSYTQNVQWTSGTGTWNSTNTAGMFTPFSIYTLTVTDSEGQPVSWPVGPDEYTCARVTFSATVDTNVDD